MRGRLLEPSRVDYDLHAHPGPPSTARVAEKARAAHS
jgi:hypothetical protein